MTDNNKTLLPCPFCGATPFLHRGEGIVGISCGLDSACNKTGLCVAFSPEKEASAIDAWNRRAAPVADSAEKSPASNGKRGKNCGHSEGCVWPADDMIDEQRPAVIRQFPNVDAEASAMAKDAERYRYLRHFTRGQQTFGGVSTGAAPRLQWFEFPAVAPLGNVMKGAVSQHLDEAIDAAIAASAHRAEPREC